MRLLFLCSYKKCCVDVEYFLSYLPPYTCTVCIQMVKSSILGSPHMQTAQCSQDIFCMYPDWFNIVQCIEFAASYKSQLLQICQNRQYFQDTDIQFLNFNYIVLMHACRVFVYSCCALCTNTYCRQHSADLPGENGAGYSQRSKWLYSPLSCIRYRSVQMNSLSMPPTCLSQVN